MKLAERNAQREIWRVDSTGPSILDELMTATDVAVRLQMRVSTIEAYARRGILPSVKLGRHRRFLRSQVEQAITALVEYAAEPSPTQK